MQEVFTAYRACKRLLARDIVPHPQGAPAAPGYAKALDPEWIHAGRVWGALPPRVESPMATAQEVEWQRFVWRVDWGVRQLPRYQNDLIRVRFLGERYEPLPDDAEAHDRLRGLGWLQGGIDYFAEQKREALIRLSKRWRVIMGQFE